MAEDIKKAEIPKELREKLEQALKSGKYFIRITCDVGGPIGTDNLKHYWITENFPKDKLRPTIDYFKDDILNKELGANTKKWE